MTSNNQPDRGEATWLAVVMAIAGVPFLFDKLGLLMHTNFLSVASFLHSTPVPLVAVGAILLLAEQGALTTPSHQKERQGGRHEL